MADISKSIFETIYAGILGVFQDNSNREISEEDMRNFSQDIADSLFPLTVETTITAVNMQGLGSVSQALVSAPASGYYLSVYRVLMSKKAGAVAFDFPGPLVIETSGGDVLFYIDASYLKVAWNVNLDIVKQGISVAEATGLRVRCDGGNASVGDSDCKFKVYYKLEAVFV